MLNSSITDDLRLQYEVGLLYAVEREGEGNKSIGLGYVICIPIKTDKLIDICAFLHEESTI